MVQKLCFTKDHQFLLKTVSASNFFNFKRIFHEGYFKLVDEKEDQQPLIAKVYGVFCLESIEGE
jgi:hypothetical protein